MATKINRKFRIMSLLILTTVIAFSVGLLWIDAGLHFLKILFSPLLLGFITLTLLAGGVIGFLIRHDRGFFWGIVTVILLIVAFTLGVVLANPLW